MAQGKEQFPHVLTRRKGNVPFAIVKKGMLGSRNWKPWVTPARASGTTTNRMPTAASQKCARAIPAHGNSVPTIRGRT